MLAKESLSRILSAGVGEQTSPSFRHFTDKIPDLHDMLKSSASQLQHLHKSVDRTGVALRLANFDNATLYALNISDARWSRQTVAADGVTPGDLAELEDLLRVHHLSDLRPIAEARQLARTARAAAVLRFGTRVRPLFDLTQAKFQLLESRHQLLCRVRLEHIGVFCDRQMSAIILATLSKHAEVEDVFELWTLVRKALSAAGTERDTCEMSLRAITTVLKQVDFLNALTELKRMTEADPFELPPGMAVPTLRAHLLNEDLKRELEKVGLEWENLDTIDQWIDEVRSLPDKKRHWLTDVMPTSYKPSAYLTAFFSKFLKKRPEKRPASTKQPQCRDFARGACSRGSLCRFSHDDVNKRTRPRKSGDVRSSSSRSTNDKRSTSSRGSTSRSSSSSSSTSEAVCYNCHNRGHKTTTCYAQQCSCKKRGAPSPGCPKYKSKSSAASSLSVNATGIDLNDPGSKETPARDGRSASPTISQPPAVPVAASLDGGLTPGALPGDADDQRNVVPAADAGCVLRTDCDFIARRGKRCRRIRRTVLLDTGADVNIIAKSIALNFRKVDPVWVHSSDHTECLDTLGTVCILADENNERVRKFVHGYVRADSSLPHSTHMIMGCHTMRQLLPSMAALAEDASSVLSSRLPEDNSPILEQSDDFRTTESEDCELNWSELKAREFVESGKSLKKSFSYKDVQITDDVEPELRARVEQWARESAEIFATSEIPPKSTQFEQRKGAHKVQSNGKPPFHAPFPTYKPFSRKLLEEMTQRNLDEGVFVPNPGSPWAFLMHIVDKSSGAPRFVVDLRMLNDRTVVRKTTMPDGLELVERISAEAKYRFHTDASSCYTQFPVHEDSYDYFTVHTPLGKMAYTRLIMGYHGSSFIQQEYYNEALRDLPSAIQACLVNYADDFAGWEDDPDKFMDLLYAVTDMCRKYGIFLNPRKTVISGPDTDTEFYGCKIRARNKGGGSSLAEDKCAALRDLRSPTSVKEVRSIVGVLAFSRHLVPHYASRIKPLTELTTKRASQGKFVFSAEAERALRGIVAVLVDGATRYKMNTSVPLHMDVDASTHGWGAHLWQSVQRDGQEARQSIAWLSKQWPPSLRSRPSFVLEAHALFAALRAVRPWAFSHPEPVEVRTDAQSVTWALKSTTGPVAGYAAEAAAETPHTITYLQGSKNVVADALSRPPLVGPKVLSVDGLDDMVTLLLDKIEHSLTAPQRFWVYARKDTSEMASLIRKRFSPQSVDTHSPNPARIASNTADMSIFAPKVHESPALIRRLLDTDSSFAVLIPHDLIPRVAENDDKSINEAAVQGMADVSFIASTSAMFTWVLRVRSTTIPHYVVMALDTTTQPSSALTDTVSDYLNVSSWAGHQDSFRPKWDKGHMVTRESDGLLLYVGLDGLNRVVVPVEVREHLITAAHLELQHLKDRYVLQHLRRYFWFPGMTKTVRAVLERCQHCQLSTAHRRTAHGDYHAPTMWSPRTRWQIDTKKYSNDFHVLACIDTFSAYVVLIPLRDRKAATVRDAFIDNIIMVYGVPFHVRFDVSRSFGKAFVEGLQAYGVATSETGADHPQGNSQVERFWPLYKSFFMQEDKRSLTSFEEFARCLRQVAWAHNIAIKPYGLSPFEVTFGSASLSALQRKSLDLSGLAEPELASDARVEQWSRIHDLNAEYCAKAGKLIREATAARLNGRARPATFAVGDRVVIHRDPSGTTARNLGTIRDHVSPWIGPATVKEVRNGGMYVLKLGRSTYLRNVRGLRPYVGPATIRMQRFDPPARGRR